MAILVARFECTSRVLKNDVKLLSLLEIIIVTIRQLLKQERKLDE